MPISSVICMVVCIVLNWGMAFLAMWKIAQNEKKNK